MKILLLLLLLLLSSSSSSTSSSSSPSPSSTKCVGEFLGKFLSDFFSWTPTVKFCLTRQLRMYSSVGIVSYRIFLATAIMNLFAILLKVTFCNITISIRQTVPQLLMKVYIFLFNFFKVYFNIIIQAKRNSWMWYAIFRCSNTRLLCVLCVLHVPARAGISAVVWSSAL